MHIEGVAIIPRCAECEAYWLPADEARWQAWLTDDEPPNSSSTARHAASGSSAATDCRLGSSRLACESDPALVAALGLLARDDHEAVTSDQGAEPRQLVARRKQKSSRLPLSLFVDAPRERNDLSASAPSALASDFDTRTDVCRLVALAHVSAPLRLARSTSRSSGLADGFRRVAKELQPSGRCNATRRALRLRRVPAAA
jgi:hypothetical protein